jgi:hypothetical protein
MDFDPHPASLIRIQAKKKFKNFFFSFI